MSIQINNDENKSYVILGAPHSGTSFIAKCLYDAGVFMGEDFYSHNYEDLEFVALNDRMLKACEGRIFRPPNKPIDSKINFSEKIQKIFQERRDNHAFWGFKDPRTALVASQYICHMQDDCYLICIFRKPRKSAKSLSDKFNKYFSFHMINEYNKRIIKAIQEFIK